MSEYIITDEQIMEIIGHISEFYVPSWMYKFANPELIGLTETKFTNVGVYLSQIVRCRDCKYYEDGKNAYGVPRQCLAFGHMLDYGSGFCAWGERKEHVIQD